MDCFYRTENIEVFRKWVYYEIQKDSRLTLEKYDEKTYKIFYKNRIAKFVIWPIGIIEETINEGEELLFYLHYQFQNFHYAKELFYRMIKQLTEDETKERRHILLSCTGGLTTGYFAEKMNEYCRFNHLSYHIDACSIVGLDNVYDKYDLILIAPQLRYKVIELSQRYQPTVVLSIDPTVFATYDCIGLSNQIEKYYRGKNNE